MKKRFFCFLPLFIYCISLSAQESSWQAGVKAMGELTMYDNGFAYGAGIQVVYKSKQRFGLETGVQWQHRKALTLYVEGNPPNPVPPEKVTYYTNRLQVPFLFRYNAKLFNFTLGPVLDIDLSTTVKTNSVDPALKNYNPYGSRAGISAGISHTFNLSGKWVLEPALRGYYVNIDEEDNGGISIDIAFRRRIF